MPGISMPLVFDLGRGGYAPASGHAAPDEQGYSAPGNLCCKQRDRASPVLCAERASAYVPAQPEMLERAEIFPHPADLEQIYLHHQGAANAGHFAGLSGGRLRLETGTEYPVRAFRLGGPVELAQLLDYIPDSNGEQQRLEGLMRKSRLSLAEAKGEVPRLV